LAEYTAEFIIEAHRHSSLHRNLAAQSKVCACFYCRETFRPDEIYEWCDAQNDDEDVDGITALCPRCGIDSVLFSFSGLPIDDPDFLKQMNIYWFLH
jgi:hypothetical protein